MLEGTEGEDVGKEEPSNERSLPTVSAPGSLQLRQAPVTGRTANSAVFPTLLGLGAVVESNQYGELLSAIRIALPSFVALDRVQQQSYQLSIVRNSQGDLQS